MDMKIKAETVRSERIKRAWSQDQLAAAAGLSLRTVQRIEKSGIAASESVQALSAVLGVPIGSLQTDRDPQRARTPAWSLRIGAAFAGGALTGLLIASGTTASAVDFTVKTYLNSHPMVEHKQIGREPVTIPLRDGSSQERVRVRIIASELEDGKVWLDLLLYDCGSPACKEFKPASVITKYGEPAKVEWGLRGGDVVTYEVTPSK
jgi:transcriptional regulator with XRE-family HTH domain